MAAYGCGIIAVVFGVGVIGGSMALPTPRHTHRLSIKQRKE